MRVSALVGGIALSALMAIGALAEPGTAPGRDAAVVARNAGRAAGAEKSMKDENGKPLSSSRMYVNAKGDTVTVELSRDVTTGTIVRKETVTTKDGKSIEHGSTTVKDGDSWKTTAYAVDADGKKTTSKSTSTREGNVRTSNQVVSKPNGETVNRHVTATMEKGLETRQVEGNSSNGNTWTNTTTEKARGVPVAHKPARPEAAKRVKAPAAAKAAPKREAPKK